MSDVEVRPPDEIRLEPEWKSVLSDEFKKPYMANLKKFLVHEMKAKKVIFPPSKDIFSALNYTPLSQVKVVILGQDPYHGPNQAHGLCFSVKEGIQAPPSLQNIFKEIESDLGVKWSGKGDLSAWAKQGILLLNTVLTVEKGKAGAHQGKGWENFTDEIIMALNRREDPVIFVLWGSPAQKKEALITNSRHKILKAPHPSPLSAHRGFFGSKHFSKINETLKKWGKEPIDWQI